MLHLAARVILGVTAVEQAAIVSGLDRDLAAGVEAPVAAGQRAGVVDGLEREAARAPL